MSSLTDAAVTALYALDAATAALRDAEERLRLTRARVLALDDGIGWVSPAATAFRQALADWAGDVDAASHLVDALEQEVRSARARLLAGAVTR